MNIQKSIELFAKAQTLLPGGVDSPARAFRAVGGQPLFIDRGEGAYLVDVDGNRFVDYVLSFGPLIRGHAHPEVVQALADTAVKSTSFGAPSPLEVELAELVMGFMPNIEMIRFVNSGTEATMSALRLARAFTGRSKIIKFQGNYHGHADMLLVTGPVTRNMELALEKAYRATPDPKVVVAVGACGISGGIFGVNYATVGGVDRTVPVDVYIPGCPPRPQALLHGILLAVGRMERKGLPT